MNSFEMIVNDIFYLSNNRMVFSGKFVYKNSVHLPIDATIFVNQMPVSKIKLTVLPFSVGANVRRDIDNIEASEQIDLKFINWEKDSVVIRENTKK